MRKNIKLATFITYLTIILGNAISLFYTPFALSKLGKSQYGLFSLVNSIIAYIYLMDMGFGDAVIRYNSKYIAEKNYEGQKKINGMFLVLYLIIGASAFIIGLIIYFNIGSIFNKGLNHEEIIQMKAMFIVAIINLALSFPLNIFNSIIMANEEFVYIKIVNLIRTILNPIVMLCILLIGYRAFGMIIASTIFNLLIGIGNVMYCFKFLNLKIKFDGFNKTLFIEILKYSFFVFLASIAYQIYWNTDQFLLGMFVSSTIIAVYAVAMQFNTYFISLSNVLSSMFLPKLTKITAVDQNNAELMKILIKVSRMQFFVCSYIFMAFVLVGKQFIIRWVGKGYSLAYIIAIIVMFPQIFSIIQSLFATMLEAMNKHKIKAYIYLSVSVLNLILSILLVQRFQALGCAVSTAVGMLINAIANNFYYKYNLKLNMKSFWKEILKLCIPSCLVFVIGIGIVNMFNITTYLHILLFGIAFSFIYFCVFWLIGFNKYEKNIVFSLINIVKIKI